MNENASANWDDVDLSDVVDDSVTPEAPEDQPTPGAPEDQPAPGEDFTLKHLGETHRVSREEVITLAQKGMDYDRIRQKHDHLAQAGNGETDIGAEASRRQDDIKGFMTAYPEVTPEDIPQQVWGAVNAGETLVSAYARYENRQLKLQLEAEKKNLENLRRGAGSRASAGAGEKTDPLDQFWYED